MMNPLVSIIIPVYQTEEYLADCLNSVMNQSYKETEIIVIDDGSTDGSPKICDDFALLDSRIKVIHKENEGLSSARNAGIEVCKGEYVTFVDSDDVIADIMVEEMVTVALQENADIVKMGVIRKKDYSENIPIKKEHFTYKGNEALKLIFKSNSQIICGCGKLFHRDVIGEVRFPLGRYYEDEYFTPRMYSRARKVVLSDSEYYFYMQRDNDSILRGKLTEKKITDSLWVSRDRIEFFKSLNMPGLVKEAKVDYYYKIASFLDKLKSMDNFNSTTTEGSLLRLKREFIRDNFLLYVAIRTKGIVYHLIKG
ncbi:MAG: glycosyltransferase family 2 protein [Faecousia sp.]